MWKATSMSNIFLEILNGELLQGLPTNGSVQKINKNPPVWPGNAVSFQFPCSEPYAETVAISLYGIRPGLTTFNSY